MSKQRSSVGIQMPAQRSLIGRSMSAPPPVLSPSTILPPPSPPGAFFCCKEKFSARIKKVLISIFHFFLLKSRTSEIALSRGVFALPSSFAFTLQLKENDLRITETSLHDTRNQCNNILSSHTVSDSDLIVWCSRRPLAI